MSDYGFKFEIGQQVRHVAAQRGWVDLFIIERQLVDCSGGVRRSYVCRQTGPLGVGENPIALHEMELRSLTDDEVTAQAVADLGPSKRGA